MDTKNESISEKYKDIIYLPHHVSKNRPQMKISDRAAQFAPFSAVVGHGSSVKEAARYTVEKKELNEDAKAIIDKELSNICSELPSERLIQITYFKKDKLKEGGKYLSLVGKVMKIDTYKGELYIEGQEVIKIDDIYDIDGEYETTYRD